MYHKLTVVCLLLLPTLAQAAPQVTTPVTTRADSLLFGINQGKAGQEEISQIQEQYAGFASFLGKTLGRPVKLSTSQNLGNSDSNLQKGRYAFFYARPANVAAKAIQSGKYRLVAMAKGAFSVKFIVNPDSPLKRAEDIRGKRVALPQGTFMEQAGLATLRDHGLQEGLYERQETRYQDAVAFMIKNHYADVGIVAPAIANDWQQHGGRILFESRKMPFWSVIASSEVSDADVAKVRAALISLSGSEDGNKLLQQLGVKEFVAGRQQDYLDMLAWLDKSAAGAATP